MKLKELKENLRKNPQYRRLEAEYNLNLEISEMVTYARVKEGLTQKDLAKKVGTRQPGIARLENDDKLPSLTLLNKVAGALGTYLIAPRFASLLEENPFYDAQLVKKLQYSSQEVTREDKLQPKVTPLFETEDVKASSENNLLTQNILLWMK